jgi:hypothetical protein
MSNLISRFIMPGKPVGLWSSRRALRSRIIVVLVAVAALAGSGVLSVSRAEAAPTPAPAWQATELAVPSVLSPGQKDGKYDIVVENVGGEASSGEFTVSVGIPAGLRVTQMRGEPEGATCDEASGEVVCHFTESQIPGGFALVQVLFEVIGEVSSLPSVLESTVAVSGGGAAHPATTEAVINRGEKQGETGPGGVSEFHMTATGPAGEPVTQAGGHPDFFTTQLTLNNMNPESWRPGGLVLPVEAVKDLVFYLPLGMLGDPAVTSPCPASLVETFPPGKSGCPASSHVGTVLPMILGQVYANEFDPTHGRALYSVTPEKGYAAEFAFASNNLTFFLYANVVRHDGQYVLRVATPGFPGIARFVGAVATFYGDIEEQSIVDGELRPYERGAFLTDPSDCEAGGSALEASVAFSTWEHPELQPSEESASSPQFKSFPTFAAIEGCNRLQFSSSLTAGPDVRTPGDTTQADEPSGYSLDLKVPQAPSVGSGLATPPFKTLDFAFPQGTVLSPGAANGLTACTASGPQGIDIEGSGSEEVAADGLDRPAAGHCPSSSIVGNVRASTPLLGSELSGHLYLAEPECGNSTHPNPCTPEDAQNGSLFHLYLELQDEQAGVVVKLPGRVEVDPGTGRVRTVFTDTPQFPVSDLVVETSGGPRASLSNPQTCGTATTNALVEPWSGGSASTPQASFEVNEGCGPQGFSPAFTAGSTSPLAGAYTPFTLTLKREDREQDIGALSTTLPEGLLAAVKNVAQCPEPQANQGGCPAASQIGTTTVGIGSGTDPFYQTGQVFLTGPYDGDPFGLSVVVPAVAGPFNLGNVIVRVGLKINPNTTQVTAETPPAGAPGGLPQIIDGVPLRIRTINVTLNNPAFTLNPTSCARSSITGTVTSTQGAATGIGAPFEANGCRDLPFKPSLTASTQAKTSKAAGASLVVKVTSSTGQANIAKVDLALPKQLPARLTTLQKACTEAQFNTNPAGCPEASDIGTATAITPILKTPLTGPAYLVSHGGAAFPDVEFILQGENGVEIVLDGGTKIKNGITYSKFETVPDAPISSFETVLPEGPHSVLATDIPTSAKNDLCGTSLTMPTTITGQNGAVITKTTKIAVTGCPKTKSLTRAQKLAAALKACHKDKNKAKRASCERQARKQYGPVKTKKKKGGKKK